MNFKSLRTLRLRIAEIALSVYLSAAVDEVSPPTTSTQVFYISVSVCCFVIFLVAIVLAIMHLHSMKRVEIEDRSAALSLLFCSYFAAPPVCPT